MQPQKIDTCKRKTRADRVHAQKKEDIEYRAKMDDDLSGETAEPMPPPLPGLEFVCKGVTE